MLAVPKGFGVSAVAKHVQERERVIVRFAGDSGDGMQLVGGRFTDATAMLGNDLATLPNFPAEIRAPAGTLAGVSSFQIHFAARDILTPGDTPNVLIAMNPAALRANIGDLERGATIIANEDAFSKRNLQKAGYEGNPLEDGSLEGYVVQRVPMNTICQRAMEGMPGIGSRDALRSKNLFALGLVSWLYDRPTAVTEAWIEQRFARNKPALDANLTAFRAGWAFGETTELIDVQRAGPSTGMPTKTEQSDLLMALHGRHGESPLPIVCATTPAQCFDATLEAARIAVRYRTPVILLTDLFLANSSEPWMLPDVDALPRIDPHFAARNGSGPFQAYARDADGARPWAVPGTPGLMHRIGGIEKSQPSGGISYETANHQTMTNQRRERIAGIEVAPLVVDADPGAELLVVGWGSSYGSLRAAVRRLRVSGHPVAHAQFHHLNPLPANTGEVLGAFKRVLVTEMNDGQLVKVLRGEFRRDIDSYAVTQGRPLLAAELEAQMLERL